MRIVMSWLPVVTILLTTGYANKDVDPVPTQPSGDISTSKRYQEPERTNYPADIPEVLDLASALTLALQNNPALAASCSEINARDAAVRQAGALPNPELYGEIGNIRGTNELWGFDESEITIGFSQLLEVGGKRGKRRAVAKHEMTLAQWEYQSKKLEILAATASAFFQVLEAQEQVSLNRELLEIADKTASAVIERFDAGKIPPVEKSRALIELAAARTDAHKVARGLEAARRRLAGLWGSNRATFSRATGSLDNMGDIPSADSLEALVSKHPDIARWKTEIEQSKVRLSAERSAIVPDLTISAGVRNSRASDENAIVGGISLPLPLFNRNRGGVREARVRIEQVALEQKAAHDNGYRALSDTWVDLCDAHAEASSLRDEILPAATETFASTELGYREGKFDFLHMLDAQRTLFMVKRRYLESLGACHLAAIEIKRITGGLLYTIPIHGTTFGEETEK